jgi:4'-phosphopantetheinyl transferase EntD
MHIETLILNRAGGTFAAYIATSCATLPELLSLKNSILHADEHTYYNTLVAPKRQHSYLHGRYTARQAAAAFCQEPARIKIIPGVFQQPVLEIPGVSNIQLTLSHTDNWCGAVVFPEAHPMGIDVEMITPEIHETVNGIITEPERLLLPGLQEGITKPMLPGADLALLWTMKEALSKTLRTGLMTPLQVYEVSYVIHIDGVTEAHFTNFAQYKALSWLSGDHAWSIVLPKNSMPDPAVLAKIRAQV